MVVDESPLETRSRLSSPTSLVRLPTESHLLPEDRTPKEKYEEFSLHEKCEESHFI